MYNTGFRFDEQLGCINLPKAKGIMENKLIKTTGSLVGNEYKTSQFKMSRLNVEPAEIAEKQELLEWLKYNDFMYFEKIQKSGTVNCKEQYWFQTYINMPVKQLRNKVKFISSLMGDKDAFNV